MCDEGKSDSTEMEDFADWLEGETDVKFSVALKAKAKSNAEAAFIVAQAAILLAPKEVGPSHCTLTVDGIRTAWWQVDWMRPNGQFALVTAFYPVDAPADADE